MMQHEATLHVNKGAVMVKHQKQLQERKQMRNSHAETDKVVYLRDAISTCPGALEHIAVEITDVAVFLVIFR